MLAAEMRPRCASGVVGIGSVGMLGGKRLPPGGDRSRRTARLPHPRSPWPGVSLRYPVAPRAARPAGPSPPAPGASSDAASNLQNSVGELDRTTAGVFAPAMTYGLPIVLECSHLTYIDSFESRPLLDYRHRLPVITLASVDRVARNVLDGGRRNRARGVAGGARNMSMRETGT